MTVAWEDSPELRVRWRRPWRIGWRALSLTLLPLPLLLKAGWIGCEMVVSKDALIPVLLAVVVEAPVAVAVAVAGAAIQALIRASSINESEDEDAAAAAEEEEALGIPIASLASPPDKLNSLGSTYSNDIMGLKGPVLSGRINGLIVSHRELASDGSTPGDESKSRERRPEGSGRM